MLKRYLVTFIKVEMSIFFPSSFSSFPVLPSVCRRRSQLAGLREGVKEEKWYNKSSEKVIWEGGRGREREGEGEREGRTDRQRGIGEPSLFKTSPK